MALTNETSFDFIRYACCWEDANILMDGLDVQSGEKVLSICSGGDNSFALLANDPSLVVAVDISQVQLYIAELKKTALLCLSYNEVLHFLGYRECSDRKVLFGELKNRLSEPCRQYWENNSGDIETGIIYNGKFEKYLRSFAKYFIPLIHSKKTIDQLFNVKSAEEQKLFYTQKWNNLRWKFFFKIFFSKYIMGKFGRDPQFLKQVNISVSDYIKSRADEHLSSPLAQHNIFLRYCLKGKFDLDLPAYLQYDNYLKIKANLDKIVFLKGYAQDAFNQYGIFNKMNLSNIFEYMDKDTFINTANELIDHLSEDGRIAYWNLMVDQSASQEFPSKISELTELSEKLSAKDRGFFYKRFLIDQKL